MKTSELMARYKKGGVVTNTVVGVAMLIISVIIMFVVLQSLTGANLLGSGTINTSAASQQDLMRLSYGNLTTNFTSGVDNISAKIPTILLIVAVVFLFGALVLLVQQARNMGFGSGAGDGL